MEWGLTEPPEDTYWQRKIVVWDWDEVLTVRRWPSLHCWKSVILCSVDEDSRVYHRRWTNGGLLRSVVRAMVWEGICGQERKQLGVRLMTLGVWHPSISPTAAMWCRLSAWWRQTPYSQNRTKLPWSLQLHGVLLWPACSPDTYGMSWIVVFEKIHSLANQQQMIQALQREWLRNPRDLTRRLTFFACIEASDEHTLLY